jgi:adenylosuccinate synthase
MPVSVVVGGQYGSEGKGKVALELVRRDPSTTIVVRPGGTNSGHTAYAKDGRRVVLRQLPAGAIDGNVKVVLPAGSYIDVGLLQREIVAVGLAASQIMIDPRAHIVSEEHLQWEHEAGLVDSIGSTGSGTGAAVLSRIARFAPGLPAATLAGEVPELLPFVQDTAAVLTSALISGERVVVEGTQGFGLSPIHGESWPKCTSRDTTAAAFLSETGIGPRHVDQIVLVIRCHPIRVAGDSGPLVDETTWDRIAEIAGAPSGVEEFTSVTRKLRRVGHFSPEIVRRAIAANSPTEIALNHLDYVDWNCRTGRITATALQFVRAVEVSIEHRISMVGTNEFSLTSLDRETIQMSEG